MSKKQTVAAGFTLPRPPKRTPVNQDTAERFVEKRSTRTKRKEAGERLTIYIPTDLAEEVRVRCAKGRRSLSDAGTEAFSLWMNQ